MYQDQVAIYKIWIYFGKLKLETSLLESQKLFFVDKGRLQKHFFKKAAPRHMLAAPCHMSVAPDTAGNSRGA